MHVGTFAQISEVLAPPGYGGFYGETSFVWRQDSILSSRQLRARQVSLASGVTAAAVSRTALAWHKGQGRGEGVHLSVYRPIGSSGGDPGWTEYDTSTRATQRIGLDPHLMKDPEQDLRQLWG